MNIKNKIVVVTGAGNGVGRELAMLLLDKEAIVVAVDINNDGLSETYKASGKHRNLCIYQTNIASLEEVKHLVIDIKRRYGKIDLLINNAGIIQPFLPISEIRYELIEKIMNVNFYGMVYMTKEFIPLLEKSNRGYIVNVSSMGGVSPVPGQAVYGASKAAVKLFSEALYAELKGSKIGLSVIVPGGIATNIMKNSDLDMKEKDIDAKAMKILLTPKRAAELIIKCVKKEKFKMTIGKDAKVLMLLYKFAPKFAITFMKKMIDVK